MRIPIAVSARHAHLSQATIDRLFGPNHSLQKHSWLSQTGQFAAEETISLIGATGRINHVRLMGPPRAQDQIEISRTDELALGIDAPLRLSGELTDTPTLVLEGPTGATTVTCGVIRALRHIHMSPADAERLGVRHGDVVRVSIDSEGRDLVFGDVAVRVGPDFRLELHLDTDEANAAGVIDGDCAQILPKD
jgi:acetate kinase